MGPPTRESLSIEPFRWKEDMGEHGRQRMIERDISPTDIKNALTGENRAEINGRKKSGWRALDYGNKGLTVVITTAGELITVFNENSVKR